MRDRFDFAWRIKSCTLILLVLLYLAETSDTWIIVVWYFLVFCNLSARCVAQFEFEKRPLIDTDLRERKNNSAAAMFLWPILGVYLIISHMCEKEEKK